MSDQPPFTYRDFISLKTKRTRGKFAGWTSGGPLMAKYAIFQNPRGQVIVPEYLLTAGTKQRLREEQAQ